MRRHAVRPAHPRVAVEAVARVDKRTKDLTKRMQLGEIAVIDHADIDRVAAEGLIAAGVGAVLNAAPSITGRYPNGGPIRLVEAGILLVDDLGPDVMAIAEGQVVHVEPDGLVSSHLSEIARGNVRGIADVTEAMEAARANIGEELERFAENTLEYIRQEAAITFEPLMSPWAAPFAWSFATASSTFPSCRRASSSIPSAIRSWSVTPSTYSRT